MQILIWPLSHCRWRVCDIRDRCPELSEFREEETAPTAMQSRIPVQLILKSKHDPLDGIQFALSWPVSRPKVTRWEGGRLFLSKSIV